MEPPSPSPYFVIRTEKEPLHAVAIGSPLSELLTQSSGSSLQFPSTWMAFGQTTDSDNAPQLTATLNRSARPKVEPSGHWLLPQQNKIEGPRGSSGIFDDSSSDEEILSEAVQSSTGGFFGHTGSRDENQGLEVAPKINADPDASLAQSRIIYVGGGQGSIGVYESSSGRLLDRVEGAHGTNSVLLLEELRSDHNGILFASQGRDGYIKFWKLELRPNESQVAMAHPALHARKQRVEITASGSPVFVGGEAFCKASFAKQKSLCVTCSERGSIAIWDYEELQSKQASGTGQDTTFVAPKCVVSYEGDKYGMCMTLQLIEATPKTPTTLLSGFEDGSILAWSLIETDIMDANGQPKVVLYYEHVSTLKAFEATPVLSFCFENLSVLQQHQDLTPSEQTADISKHIMLEKAEETWIGVGTSSEDEIVVFSLEWSNAAIGSDAPKAQFLILEKIKMPHAGYQDVKLRSDSLLALAGWDHRVRLFLLELRQAGASAISVKLQNLLVLKYHAASVQSIALGSAEKQLLVSVSTDTRAALWRTY